MPKVPISALHNFGVSILRAHHVTHAAATDVMNVLIGAESRGFASHGLLRLNLLITGIESGTHKPEAVTDFNHMGVCVEADGNGGLGPHVASSLMQQVVAKAQEHGVSIGVGRNMSHFGFGGYYTEMAAQQGLLGLVMCNTQPASSPFGGRGKVLGTNPISFSCPPCGIAQHPITVDMATTAAARGKLLSHQLNGEPLPEFIAADVDGIMTTDPDKGLAGTLMPLGGIFGYKGTALAVMVDILSGSLSGADTGKRVQGTATTTVPCTAGFFFAAIDPTVFGHDKFEQNTKAMFEDMLLSGEDVLLPGSREHQNLAVSEKEGLQLKPDVRKMLETLGEKSNVPLEF